MSRAATQSAREKCCSVGMSEEEKERDEFVYCLEACPLKKSQLNAVDFALNCAFRKIFSTRSQEVVEMCKLAFSRQTLSDAVANRKCKFLSKFIVSDNVLCNVFKDVAIKELLAIDSNASY